MRAHCDWTGQRWGALVATQYVSQRLRTGARWIFQCDCGSEKIMHIRRVRKGEYTTCGACSPTLAPNPTPKPAITWPFPRIVGTDGKLVSPVWRAHENNVTRR